MSIKMDNRLSLVKQAILECRGEISRLISIDNFISSSPNISFENFIPSEELSPDPENNTNSSIENPIRRQTYRFPKAFNQSTVNPSKTFFERTDQSGEKLSNKFNRKQRFNTNHHVPHAHLQQANQLINMRSS